MASQAAPPAWNRFACWDRTPALLALAVTLALLVLSALTSIGAGEDYRPSGLVSAEAPRPERDPDLALYDRVIERLKHGENYYQAVAIEHRQSNYPLNPGLAVRLPTLAMLESVIPVPGQIAASMLLFIAVLAAWWRRLGEEPGGLQLRPPALVALSIGASIGTFRYFFVLHELWAGSLLALSMGLHRPGRGKWLGAWMAAAAALSIREHALPFVLLMAAFAWWHRRWREGAAWLALVAIFVAAIAWHLHIVSGLVHPGDPHGPSWITLRGFGGWLSMVVLSSNLRWLPHFLAGPLVVLMLLGWAGWRSSAGAFATLLYLGYGLVFMIAGRGHNWYWGLVIAPTMFIGLAFTSLAMSSLWRAAFPWGPLATRHAT